MLWVAIPVTLWLVPDPMKGFFQEVNIVMNKDY